MSSYSARLVDAICDHDGENVAKMLNPENPDLLKSPKISDQLAPAAWRGPIGVLSSFQLGRGATGSLESLEQLKILIKKLISTVETEERWAVPVLLKNCSLFLKLVRSQKDPSVRTHWLNEVATLIRSCYRIMVTDRNEDLESNRAWGRYAAATLLFRTYHSLEMDSAIDSFVQTLIQQKIQPPLDWIPKREQSPFLFFRGITDFAAQRYEGAVEHLLAALATCQEAGAPKRSQEQVLVFLLPAILLHKQLYPRRAIWKQYPTVATLYEELISATRQGNMRAFDAALTRRRHIFIKNRLYLAAETLSLQCLLHLVWRTWKIAGRPRKLNIGALTVALRVSGAPHTPLDAQMLVARLVSKGDMKARLEPRAGTIIVDTKSPFPKLEVN